MPWPVALLLMASVAAASDSGKAGLQCPDNVCPDCSVFEPSKGQPTWFEYSCDEHTNENTTYCIDLLWRVGNVSHEHESTIGHDLNHAGVPYNILVIFGAFGVGAYVRYAFRDTAVPYTVVLFVVGMLWGGLGKIDSFGMDPYIQLANINPHLILFIFLPVLIFESAFAMHIPVFKKVVWQCVILAGPGLMIASSLTAVVARIAFHYNWTWPACLLFGTILSATDPVAVVALLKELGASPMISTLIEGESLFNDGTAIVFFTVLLEAVKKKNCEPDWQSCTGGVGSCTCSEFACTIPLGGFDILLQFLKVSLGGPLVGLIIGAVATLGMQRVFNDALIEITITIVAAYVTFFLAEGILGVSGVLGVVACGCYVSYHRHAISPEVEHMMHDFWEMTVYLTNTMIFILAGMIVSLKAFEVVGALDVVNLAILYAAINIIRCIVLVLMLPILNCFEFKLDMGNCALVTWGGLRGAVGLALALVVQADDTVIYESVRTKFLFHVAGIVMLTLCVNGVSTGRLVKYFQLDKIEPRRKRMMNDFFTKLLLEQTQTVEDLRNEALYYDANWELVGRFTDLTDTLPSGFADPYNSKGELRAGARGKDWLLEETRLAYFGIIASSVNRQYAKGTIEREAVRELLLMMEGMKDKRPQPSNTANPYSLLEGSMVEPLFDLQRSFLGRQLSLNANEKSQGVKQYLLLKAWRHALDVTLGLAVAHQLARDRFRLQPTKVASRFERHCKGVIITCYRLLEERITHCRPDISCCIKTKHAARNVLNTMRQSLGRMKQEGRLDNQDFHALLCVVEARMKNLQNFPSTLNLPFNEEYLQDIPWFTEAEEPVQNRLRIEFARTKVLEIPAKSPLEDEARKNLSALYLITSGTISIRVGRCEFSYGPGYTVGLQQLLTPGSIDGRRFSDVWAETRCRALKIPFSVIWPMLNVYPTFTHELWRAGGRAAAMILMKMDRLLGKVHESTYSDHHLRRMVAQGQADVVLDTDEFPPSATRMVKLQEDCHHILLRGKCWEYEMGDDVRVNEQKYPCMIPHTFKFATFAENAVLFTVSKDVKAGDRARKLWGRLRAKIRSINLWSGLRGEQYRRNAISVAFNRSPPPNPLEGSSKRASRRFPPPPLSSVGDWRRGSLASSSLEVSDGKESTTAKLQKQIEVLQSENKALQNALSSSTFGSPLPPKHPLIPPSSGSPSLTRTPTPVKEPTMPSAPDPLVPVLSATGSSAALQRTANGISSFTSPLLVQSPIASPILSSRRSDLGASTMTSTPSLADQVTQLAALHSTGSLSAEEFALAKQRLLGLPPSAMSSSSSSIVGTNSSPNGSPSRRSPQLGSTEVSPQGSFLSEAPRVARYGSNLSRRLDPSDPNLIAELRQKYLSTL